MGYGISNYQSSYVKWPLGIFTFEGAIPPYKIPELKRLGEKVI